MDKLGFFSGIKREFFDVGFKDILNYIFQNIFKGQNACFKDIFHDHIYGTKSGFLKNISYGSNVYFLKNFFLRDKRGVLKNIFSMTNVDF